MKTWKKALGLVLALVCLTILSGGGLAESKSVERDGVTLTRTDKELTANDYTFSEHLLTIKTAGKYTLSGTATSNDFRVKVGESGQRIQTTPTTADDQELYAHWTQNIYTVTIKADKDGKVIESQQIPEGGLAKKPANEPVREGYTFIGWQANGAAWDFDQNVVERDTEIIAQWEKVIFAPTATVMVTPMATAMATPTAMVTPTATAMATPTAMVTPAATTTPTAMPTATPTPAPIATPVPKTSGSLKTGVVPAPMAWCALGLACLAGLAAMKHRK